MKHHHKVEYHYTFHLCTVCGARRVGNTYKPWRYGYGKWAKDGKEVGQWCQGPATK